MSTWLRSFRGIVVNVLDLMNARRDDATHKTLKCGGSRIVKYASDRGVSLLFEADIFPSSVFFSQMQTVWFGGDANAEGTKGLLRNNLVTFLNASCSELWAGSDRRDPSETYGHRRGLQNKPLTRGESITGDARQEIPKLTIPPERDKIDSVIY